MTLLDQTLRKSILRRIMFIGGSIVSIITILPLPWRVRLAWARLLHFVVKSAKKKFRYIFEFKETENMRWGMGIQTHGDYESIEELESILERADVQNLPLDKLKFILECAKTQSSEEMKQGYE